MPYTRRRILATLTSVAGSSLLLQSSPAAARPGRSGPTAKQLRALVADPARARDLGLGYLEMNPHENSPRVLVGLIGSALGRRRRRGDVAPGRNALLASLDEQVRMDFGTGDTVRVRGWVLARTEARLCALFA